MNDDIDIFFKSKTALDMTKFGSPETADDNDDDRVMSDHHHHRDDRRQELPGWGERIVNSDTHARDTGRDFNDHQVVNCKVYISQMCALF